MIRRGGSFAFAMLMLVWISVPARAAEERATVKVTGNRLEVAVRHQDGSPAAGVQVRLLFGRQLSAAVARTDEQGRWIHHVSQSGAYEAVIETGPGAEDVIRLPFSVLDSEPADFPWATAVLALVCIVGALVLSGLGLKKVCTGATAGPGSGQVLFLAILLAGGGSLFAWSAWKHWHEKAPGAPTGPDVAAAARDFLRSKNVQPLSESLERLLLDKSAVHVPSMPHPLLNQRVPDFELMDERQIPWRLSAQLARGPVILVFYYGYHCNHCVGQLFALHDDVQKFHELGAEVVAVSADPPELTQDRFRQYGPFAFSVLADPGNKTAQAFGVYRPASGTMPEDLQHGTFVIGRDRRVHWVQHGDEPFTGNRTLLYEVSRLRPALMEEKR